MLDKKRIVLAAIVAVLLVAALTAGTLYLGRMALAPDPTRAAAAATSPAASSVASSAAPTSAAPSSATPSSSTAAAGRTGSGSPSSSSSPSATPSREGVESAVPLPTLDMNDLAQRAALAASSYDAGETSDNRERRYRAAYFSDDLAKSYKPVWAQVFGSLSTATIYTVTQGAPGLDKASGSDGHHTWRLGVTCVYSGQWVKDGQAHAQPPATSTWFVTIDEATNRVTKIDAPEPSTLQIRV